jgi:hypothetical protein
MVTTVGGGIRKDFPRLRSGFRLRGSDARTTAQLRLRVACAPAPLRMTSLKWRGTTLAKSAKAEAPTVLQV